MTTTTNPTTDEVRESFIKQIGRKLRAGRARCAQLFARAWSKTKSGGRTAGKNVAGWSKAGGRGAVYGLTGGLAFIGRCLHTIALFIGGAIDFALNGVAIVVGLLVALVAIVVAAVVFVAQQVVYLLVKLVHVLALVLMTPWIAFRYGKDPLKEDWEILLTGLKPRNWHILNPGALAAQTLREREAKDQGRTKAEATSNGQSPKKGRPTPRQRTRRPAKLHPEPAVA